MYRIRPVADAVGLVIMLEASQMKIQIHLEGITKKIKGRRTRVRCKSLDQATAKILTYLRMFCHVKQHISLYCLS